MSFFIEVQVPDVLEWGDFKLPIGISVEDLSVTAVFAKDQSCGFVSLMSPLTV